MHHNKVSKYHTKSIQKPPQPSQKAGFQPKLHCLDIKAPKEILSLFANNSIDYHLSLPHMHRQNAAKRAIQTWKAHFIATLAGYDKNFPMHLWDWLVSQAKLTLNMVRQCTTYLSISSATALFGLHNYNCVPLDPPG